MEVIDQEAYTYIGVMILSISKRIMNEVICTAEDYGRSPEAVGRNGIEIYYQDTDSMHIGLNDIKRLSELYL